MLLRTALLAFAVIGAAAAATPARADTASVRIELTGLQPQGQVLLQVFNSEESYRAGNGIAGRQIPITGPTASVEFNDVPTGQYAVRLFHDLNGNGELDTNPFGIPTEPFAFSNNARGSFGPASWQQAVFTLNPGENVHQIAVGGAQ
ncbi:MAG: DUF2141 domain-containing protein [Hyphomonadaceae bacterium]